MSARVYILTFGSGKSYVGVTRGSVAKRVAKHRYDASRGRGCRLVGAAWRKYGEPAVLELGQCAFDRLAEVEREMVQAIGTMQPAGYNMTPGGDVTTDEMIAKRVAARRASGRANVPPERRAKIAATLKAKGIRPPARGAADTRATREAMAAGQRRWAATRRFLASVALVP